MPARHANGAVPVSRPVPAEPAAEPAAAGVATQPIVDVCTGRAVAWEALARFGRHGPSERLAAAQAQGCRGALERSLLRRALALLSHPSRPPDARLSVNVSPLALREAGTVRLLEADGRLRGLVVEVTEDTLSADDHGVLRALGRLRAGGALIAVDDVGAGHAGLAQLAGLAPDYVKLDRRLVRGVERNPSVAVLVRVFAEWARETGARLVAEGVETEAQLDAVCKLGVPLVQGYLLGRPSKTRPWRSPDEHAHGVLRHAQGR